MSDTYGMASCTDVSENFVPFITGEKPQITDTVTIASGSNVAQRALLGRVTATGKYIPCVKTATDGSQIPRRIAIYATDATAADALCPVYCEVECNPSLLVLDGSWSSTDEVKELLADQGIYLRLPV